MGDIFLSVAQVAMRLNISRCVVYRITDLDAKPRLRFVQIGGVRRFDPRDLEEFIEAQKH